LWRKRSGVQLHDLLWCSMSWQWGEIAGELNFV
jgi:hypothetical protein